MLKITPLRFDVIFQFEVTQELSEKFKDLSPGTVYRVSTESMRAISREMILPHDTIYTRPVELKDAELNKCYVITNSTGNKYLGNINIAPTNKKIVLSPLNPDYPILNFMPEYVQSIEVIYRNSRDLTKGLPCHCASDGEYCGPGCVNEDGHSHE